MADFMPGMSGRLTGGWPGWRVCSELTRIQDQSVVAGFRLWQGRLGR
jgi:hypothetical protein